MIMIKFTFLLLILFCNSIFSDTFILKDGTVMKVKLISQNPNEVTFIMNGKESTMSKNKLRRILYTRNLEQEKKEIQDELNKMKQEKQKKIKITKEEEEEAERLVNEELLKAFEEQEKQEKLNMSFDERITKLSNEINDLKQKSGSTASIEKIEAEIKDLKKRTERIERYLKIDPDIEEYYSRKRSPWDVIWRSAIIPGWGLSYSRNGFGDFYTGMFFLTTISGYAYKKSNSSNQKDFQNKAINDFVVMPLAVENALSSSSNSALVSLSSSYDSYKSFNIASKGWKTYQRYEKLQENNENSDKLLKTALGIYIIQLIHSGIEGYFWSKRPLPGKFNEPGGNKEAGLYYNIYPGVSRVNGTIQHGWNMEIGYHESF